MPLPTHSLAIALAQLNSQDDVDANLASVTDLAARASAGGARLLVLPENCVFMGASDKKRGVAEPVPRRGVAPDEGRALRRLSAIAREHAMFVAAGGVPLASGDHARPFNAHVVFAPDGAVSAVYRKVHLFDVDLADGSRYCESDNTTAGSPADEVVAVDVDGWRVGLSICYDLRFPELYRRLVDADVHAILVPAAFTVPTGKDHWHVLLRARAIESQTYVAAPAQWGRHPEGRATYGKSLLADPWGDVIAQASDGVRVVHSLLDPQRLADVRAQVPSLRHRRI